MNNNRIITLLQWIALALCLFVAPVYSQEDRPLGVPEIDLPKFYFDFLTYPSDSAGVGRVDVYLQVPFDMLSFIKYSDIFNASYEVTVDVFDSTKEQLTEKLWTERIETRDYKESISPVTGKISQVTLMLPSASYEIVIQVRDLETKKIRQIKRSVTVRNFAALPVALSDVMVVRKVVREKEKATLTPNIAAVVTSENEAIPLYLQVQSQVIPREITYVITLEGKSGTIVYADTVTETIAKKNQSVFLSIPPKSINAGEYTLEIQGQIPDTGKLRSKRTVTTVSRTLEIRMPGIPFSITDLDKAIDQLKYIADKDTLDVMKNAPPEKKREMFLRFWKLRDSIKGYGEGDLMKEYYQRVEYANKNFGHYLEGWRTDRGNVYIIFGEPGNIERHPMELSSKPYEIWSYYDLNREFIFVDESGFGDYRLRDPLWDTWHTRYR